MVLEAMSCALPVVVSDIEPHRDLVQEGINGFLVDLDKPEDSLQKVSNSIRDRDILRTMGENGRRSVVDRYSWFDVVHAYLRLLTSPITPSG